MNNILSTIAIASLPVLGAIITEVVRIYGNKYKQSLNPAIAKVKPYFPVIDAAIDLLPAETLSAVRSNPVAVVVTELLKEEGNGLSPVEIAAAARWASKQFDFNVHEKFNVEALGPKQSELAGRLVGRLSDRILG